MKSNILSSLNNFKIISFAHKAVTDQTKRSTFGYEQYQARLPNSELSMKGLHFLMTLR